MEGSQHIADGMNEVVCCGPVTLGITAETAALRQRALGVLEHFAARWTDPGPCIDVHLRMTREPAIMGDGRFMHCSSMRVDKTAAGLVATCRSGAFATYDPASRRWEVSIHVVCDTTASAWIEDNVEDLLELVLTTAWREAGWTALHAGGVVNGRHCALLAAPAKGGKSTLTVALLQRGWRTLGDDKVLIGLRADGQPQVRGLTRRFNLDPRTGTWFPELGDLEPLPRLSRWSAKRRVMIEDVWRDCFAERAVPTHVVLIQRTVERGQMQVQRLGAVEVLSALLRQTVIPADPPAAKRMLDVLAPAARTMQGIRFAIGDDAYSDPRGVAALEELLQ